MVTSVEDLMAKVKTMYAAVINVGRNPTDTEGWLFAANNALVREHTANKLLRKVLIEETGLVQCTVAEHHDIRYKTKADRLDEYHVSAEKALDNYLKKTTIE